MRNATLKKKTVWNWKIELLFIFFLLAALFDLVMTLINLRVIGFRFEANPIIQTEGIAVLVKFAGISLIWYVLSTFQNRKLSMQYPIICITLIGILAQIFAGASHIPIINDWNNADSMKILDNGDVELAKDGILTTIAPHPFSPIYYGLVSIFTIIYPFVLGYISFLLTINLRDKKLED